MKSSTLPIIRPFRCADMRIVFSPEHYPPTPISFYDMSAVDDVVDALTRAFRLNLSEAMHENI